MFLTEATERTEAGEKNARMLLENICVNTNIFKQHCLSLSVFSVSSSESAAAERVRDVRKISGFTLIEILVVISIIAILAGMIVPTFFYAKTRAKNAKAQVAVKALETAFKSYLDTYKVWPSGLGHDQAYDISDDKFSPPPFKVFSMLRGENDAVLNPQGIAFYEFESTTNYTGYESTALDPWSDPPPWGDSTKWYAYQVMFDDDYDTKISINGQDVYRSVLVWSIGENRTNEYGEGDDVASWK